MWIISSICSLQFDLWQWDKKASYYNIIETQKRMTVKMSGKFKGYTSVDSRKSWWGCRGWVQGLRGRSSGVCLRTASSSTPAWWRPAHGDKTRMSRRRLLKLTAVTCGEAQMAKQSYPPSNRPNWLSWTWSSICLSSLVSLSGLDCRKEFTSWIIFSPEVVIDLHSCYVIYIKNIFVHLGVIVSP